jgi:hypothetical protein
VAHAYNPSYSGDRDQEDCSSKPTQANSSWDPISKKPFTKKETGRVAQGVDPSTAEKKEKYMAPQKVQVDKVILFKKKKAGNFTLPDVKHGAWMSASQWHNTGMKTDTWNKIGSHEMTSHICRKTDVQRR